MKIFRRSPTFVLLLCIVAAFGLWQIGYTHYERNEGYDELLNVHIAKYAHLNFIER